MPYNAGYVYQPLLPLNGDATYVTVLDNESYSKSKRVKGDFVHTYPYEAFYYKTKGSAAVWYQYFAYNASTKKWDNQGYQLFSADLPASGIKGTATWPYGTTLDVGKRTSLADAAKRQLNSKILNAFPSWDVLTDSVEIGQTASLFRDAGRFVLGFAKGVATRSPRTILKAFGYKPTPRRVKRLAKKLASFSKTENHFDVMSNLWMSYRYGVMPLLYSINDAIKVFNIGSWAENCYQVFHGISKDTWGTSYITDITTSPINKTSSIKYSRSGLAHAIAYVRFTSGIKARLIQNPGVALLRTAWEGVPFSFVIDWFYDISTWINSLNLDSITTSDSWGCLSEKAHSQEDVNVYNFRPLNSNYRFNYVGTSGVSITGTCHWFRRSSFSLSAAPPKLGWGISNFKRSLDSLVLSVSRVKRMQ